MLLSDINSTPDIMADVRCTLAIPVAMLVNREATQGMLLLELNGTAEVTDLSIMADVRCRLGPPVAILVNREPTRGMLLSDIN